MKELKALDLLKELESYPLGFCHFKKEILKEAIAELETLQNRSCSNCKYYHDEVCCNDNSLLLADFVNENFCCNKWEVKNES